MFHATTFTATVRTWVRYYASRPAAKLAATPHVAKGVKADLCRSAEHPYNFTATEGALYLNYPSFTWPFHA